MVIGGGVKVSPRVSLDGQEIDNISRATFPFSESSNSMITSSIIPDTRGVKKSKMAANNQKFSSQLAGMWPRSRSLGLEAASRPSNASVSPRTG